MYKIASSILITLLFSGCVSFLEIKNEPKWAEIQLTETPYERYVRHYYLEGIPGTCRFCHSETIDVEIGICEECYYRVYKVKKQEIIVEPLQLNQPFYVEPLFTNYRNRN